METPLGDKVILKQIQNPLFEPCSVATPFENIALALSGGGFRAAAYCLGVLSYLNKLEFNDHTKEGKRISVLKKVKYMSSASGGSMTNAYYTLCLAQGKSFAYCYSNLLKFMEGDIVLKRALTILNDNKAWKERPEKRKNIINAFAMVYDEDTLFAKNTVANLVHPDTHLEEVCFNSTEFYKGITFRQTVRLKQGKNQPFFGNYFIHLSIDTAAKLKLADVFAASSCFPAGFEPVIFPYDFTYVNPSLKSEGLDTDTLKQGLTIIQQNDTEKQKQFAEKKVFGLMDGGITDNQGLDSLMQADERRMKSTSSFKRFDLILVNDVGSHYMDAYEEPKAVKGSEMGFFNIRTMYWVTLLVILCSAVSTGCLLSNMLPNSLLNNILLSLSAFILGLSSLIMTVFLIIRSKLFSTTEDDDRNKQADELNIGKNFSPEIVELLIKYLNLTHFKVFQRLIKSRIVSVLALNNDVFLKHIRRLIFDRFYETPAWKNRGKGNHIYDLSKTNEGQRKRQLAKKYTPQQISTIEPTEEIMAVADRAFDMPTTLWFDKDHVESNSLKDIVTCGQFTTCYNLIEYIMTFKKEGCYDLLDNDYKARIDQLEKQLFEDWAAFKVNPSYLF